MLGKDGWDKVKICCVCFTQEVQGWGWREGWVSFKLHQDGGGAPSLFGKFDILTQNSRRRQNNKSFVTRAGEGGGGSTRFGSLAPPFFDFSRDFK